MTTKVLFLCCITQDLSFGYWSPVVLAGRLRSPLRPFLKLTKVHNSQRRLKETQPSPLMLHRHNLELRILIFHTTSADTHPSDIRIRRHPPHISIPTHSVYIDPCPGQSTSPRSMDSATASDPPRLYFAVCTYLLTNSYRTWFLYPRP